jgi:hypothetical protein
MNDKEIRELAESCGFWGADVWWERNIPRFRLMLLRARVEIPRKMLNWNCQCGWRHEDVYDGFKCQCGEVFNSAGLA